MKEKHAPKKRRGKIRVNEPLTDELLDELRAAPDPVSFANKHHITERSLREYLLQLLDEKNLRQADVINAIDVSYTYGYHIFTGKRENVSRDIVLQIAFAMKCTLQEANRLLQASGNNELYCKNRRDAIIIFCLDKGYTLQHADEELYRFGEDTIC